LTKKKKKNKKIFFFELYDKNGPGLEIKKNCKEIGPCPKQVFIGALKRKKERN